MSIYHSSSKADSEINPYQLTNAGSYSNSKRNHVKSMSRVQLKSIPGSTVKSQQIALSKMSVMERIDAVIAQVKADLQKFDEAD